MRRRASHSITTMRSVLSTLLVAVAMLSPDQTLGLKLSLDPAVNCDIKANRCVHLSSYIKHFYTMKEYCVALNYPGAENCVVTTNDACSRSEMAKYKASVCRGLHAFDSTVAQMSKDCKDRMGICLTNVVNFGYLVSEKRYCESLEFLTCPRALVET